MYENTEETDNLGHFNKKLSRDTVVVKNNDEFALLFQVIQGNRSHSGERMTLLYFVPEQPDCSMICLW